MSWSIILFAPMNMEHWRLRLDSSFLLVASSTEILFARRLRAEMFLASFSWTCSSLKTLEPDWHWKRSKLKSSFYSVDVTIKPCQKTQVTLPGIRWLAKVFQAVNRLCWLLDDFAKYYDEEQESITEPTPKAKKKPKHSNTSPYLSSTGSNFRSPTPFSCTSQEYTAFSKPLVTPSILLNLFAIQTRNFQANF